MTEEELRLQAAREGKEEWRLFGPYLSERQWGTVREDYSATGDAWNYITHDDARSRAYRWGEDGIAGISDTKQHLCFAVALWNGKDPILKERLFGLTSEQGNHGEDVKEYYFYLDNLPSHAYMKYLYKYPQEAFPYTQLVEVNGKRTREDFEYELLDTGIFNEDRYFDVFIEYAKNSPDDILIKITVCNRGKEKAPLHLLPTLWFRNTWSWHAGMAKPSLELNRQRIQAVHPLLGEYWLYCEGAEEWLFTENETNLEKLFKAENTSLFVKDGFHEYVVNKKQEAVNEQRVGTKGAPYFQLEIDGGASATVRLRLTKNGELASAFGTQFDVCFDKRKEEADRFYEKVTPSPLSEDMRNVQRQAFAGLLWNKQCYHYNVLKWLQGDPSQPKPPLERFKGRNAEWWNLDAYEIFSMPDKWEYPWFAAWDLAFHCIAMALIDPDFAKHQLLLLTKEWYMHPNGQIPAYEWSFSDVNPPVQSWAAMRVYQIEQAKYGRTDRGFLEVMFQKMTLNFTWWVNRKDVNGRNIFSGGFLGLDNIGAFNRSVGPPLGGFLEQVDGTGWMGMFCLNLLQTALELAKEDAAYEAMATKFFEHFIFIADAINNIGRSDGLWDEKEGFYYGLLNMPDGRSIRVTEDTICGVVPLFAVATNDSAAYTPFPQYRERFEWFIKHRPDLLNHIGDLSKYHVNGHLLISMASPYKLKRILEKILDESQFLSPYGVRAVSRRLAEHPYVLELGGKQYKVDYEPAESRTAMFGGNSNWRGPVWFPLNFLLIESLQKFHYYLGDDFTVEYPSGSGKVCTLWDVATDLSLRLIQIFLKGEDGRRPVYGGIEKFQTDPHWQDYILFHEYFHGDNGAGLGASAQTGWTALVAKLIQQYGAYVLEKKSPEVIEQTKVGSV